MSGRRQWAMAMILLSVGCTQNPFTANGTNTLFPGASSPAGNTAPPVAQLREWEERARKLDLDNADLHRQLAQTQQQAQLLREELSVLRRQLEDTALQLETAQRAKQEAEQRLEAVLASNRYRTGAAITANNSLTQPLRLIEIPGLQVRRDGDVIRVEIPADQLFEPGTVRWQAGAARILDVAASVLATHYPRQIIAIEAHTDNATLREGTTLHQLAASQALAVFQHLTQRSGLSERQLFTVAHGPNQPVVSNGTPAGRARNRRIELVIYPETF
jgi:flagellar motor protein MotB